MRPWSGCTPTCRQPGVSRPQTAKPLHSGTRETPCGTLPENALARKVYTGATHEEGVGALTCDGAVHRLTPKLDATAWYALVTRDGGEVLESAREQNIGSLDEIAWGILETSGKLTFIKKSS